MNKKMFFSTLTLFTMGKSEIRLFCVATDSVVFVFEFEYLILKL
jgi:hypothetical protein